MDTHNHGLWKILLLAFIGLSSSVSLAGGDEGPSVWDIEISAPWLMPGDIVTFKLSWSYGLIKLDVEEGILPVPTYPLGRKTSEFTLRHHPSKTQVARVTSAGVQPEIWDDVSINILLPDRFRIVRTTIQRGPGLPGARQIYTIIGTSAPGQNNCGDFEFVEGEESEEAEADPVEECEDHSCFVCSV